jgi:uncharacterized repeat protein (TIGR01451 family)
VGITVARGNSAILNGVLWHGNTVNTGGSGTITVSNAHTGNPAFAADGYHLTTSSAAIDQGVTAGVTSDIDGDPRPMGHGVDLGADEFRVALNVTQQAFPDRVQPGEPLTYTISVANTGDVDLNAIITDTLPTQVTASGTVFLPNGRSGITWTAVITAPGGVWMETVVVTVAKGYEGPLTNLVEVTTEQGATDRATAIANAYKVYLPLILRNN